jgi:hypothetical protein
VMLADPDAWRLLTQIWMPRTKFGRPNIAGMSWVNIWETLAAKTPPEIINKRVLIEPDAMLQRIDVSESHSVCSARVEEGREREEIDISPIPLPVTVIIPDPVAALLLTDPLISKRNIEKSCDKVEVRADVDTKTRRLE